MKIFFLDASTGTAKALVSSPESPVIGIILTPKDKANIAAMHPEATLYAESENTLISTEDVGRFLDAIKAQEVDPK